MTAEAVTGRSAPRPVAGRLVQALANGGLIILVILFTVALTGLIQPRFFNQQNIINVLRNTSMLSILSMGQMLVMIAGGFDMSVGVVVALASVEAATLMGIFVGLMPDMPILAVVLAVLATLMTGALVGTVNGLFIALLALSPFMVTLAMSSVLAGGIFYFTKGIPVFGMPDLFMSEIGRGMVRGVPIVIWIGLAAVLAFVFVQRFTQFGRHVYAIGSNPVASRLSGVRVAPMLVAVYATSGGMAALTGILMTARIGSGQSTIGATMVLESIAACVVGGVSLLGGVGRAERVMLGALFLSLVSNSMNLLRIDSKLQTLVLGVVLIAAVCGELVFRRRPRG